MKFKKFLYTYVLIVNMKFYILNLFFSFEFLLKLNINYLLCSIISNILYKIINLNII